MKRIQFKKIGLENFSCYRNIMEIEVQEGKLIIISGSNGVGKTTIFDSISFSLYGVTSKGLKGKDVVNNRSKKNCHTWLEFLVNDVKYRVDRYYSHVKYNNDVILLKNDQPFKKGQKEVLPEIEKLISPRKIFMNSLFFGQNVHFFTDLDDSERKDIFRKILKLDDYIVYNKKTKELIKDLDKFINDNENQLIIKSNMIENYKNQIKMLLEEKSKFEINNKQSIGEYKRRIFELNNMLCKNNKELLNYEYGYLNNELKIINDEINGYNNKIKDLDILLENIINEIQIKSQNRKLEIENKSSKFEMEKSNIFNNKKNEIIDQKNEIENKYRSSCAERDKNRAVLNSQNMLLNTEINNITNEKNKFVKNVIENKISTCPTCKREIDKETINNLRLDINKLEIRIKDNQEEINKNKKSISIIDNKLIESKNKYNLIMEKIRSNLFSIEQEYNSEMNSFRQKLADANSQLKRITHELIENQTNDVKNQKNSCIIFIDNTKKKLIEIEEKFKKYNQLTSTGIKIEAEMGKNEELIELKENEKFNESGIDGYKNNINEFELEIEGLKKDKLKLQKRFDVLSFWKNAFSKSGIESMLIDESIPLMNEIVNKYLDELSFGRYILSFDTVKQLGSKDEFRDKLNINVLDNESLSDSKDKFSGGQNRILDIAIILTMCDLQNNIQDISFNIMLFDEIFDSLDDDNTLRVAKLLRKLVRNRSIYIITHRHIDQIDCDEEIHL